MSRPDLGFLGYTGIWMRGVGMDDQFWWKCGVDSEEVRILREQLEGGREIPREVRFQQNYVSFKENPTLDRAA
jgi:hypothetical protein